MVSATCRLTAPPLTNLCSELINHSLRPISICHPTSPSSNNGAKFQVNCLISRLQRDFSHVKVWSIKSIGGFSGCLLYKEGRYEEALVKFNGAQQVVGYDPHLSYNVALCHYRWVVLKRNLIGSYSFFSIGLFSQTEGFRAVAEAHRRHNRARNTGASGIECGNANRRD